MSNKSFVTGRGQSALAVASRAAITPKIEAARSALHPDAPSCSTLHPTLQSATTNRPEHELSPRQLAVARALVRGGPILAIARETQTSRHTIARWRRLPKFREELKRLHELLATHPVLPIATRAAPPSRPPPRSTHAIDRKFDKMIDEYLGRGIR
jgi:transposase-like protein